MQLREVNQSEAETLAQIHEKCFPNYWDINAFNDFFSVAGTHALLVEAPAPVGMMVWRNHHEQADIITVAVLPEFRRMGIARKLVERALADAEKSGVEKIFLDVEDGNLPALTLYESFGFVQLTRRKLYYRQKDGTYTDALVMGKKFA